MSANVYINKRTKKQTASLWGSVQWAGRSVKNCDNSCCDVETQVIYCMDCGGGDSDL